MIATTIGDLIVHTTFHTPFQYDNHNKNINQLTIGDLIIHTPTATSELNLTGLDQIRIALIENLETILMLT